MVESERETERKVIIEIYLDRKEYIYIYYTYLLLYLNLNIIYQI